MAGLVPAIPIMKAQCLINRDHRDKPGDDIGDMSTSLKQARSR